MSREDRTQLVFWCKTCDLTAVVTNEWKSCGFCEGPVEEIGWVEEV